MTEDVKPLFAAHVIQQYAAIHVDLAELFGSYYVALIQHGLPEDLAGAMVLDRQSQLVGPSGTATDSPSCNCGCGGKS